MAVAPRDTPAGSYAYRPQIDGLRALAVGGVLLAHFFAQHLPTGQLGVRLFFVISGFLITERLLDARAAVAAGRGTAAAEIGRFFLRRVLRIFPAYYVLLTVLLVFDAGGIRASAPWHLFHASNLWFARTDDWQPWVVAHFWSLSIEEQFYLVWPWLIVLLPSRFLKPAVIATVVAGIAFRVAVLSTPLADGPVAIWVVTPAALDPLGLGALMALAARQGRTVAAFRRLAIPALLLWLAIDGAVRAGWLTGSLTLSYAVQTTICAVCFAGLVARAHENRADWFGRTLACRPLVAMGRISYGIYLFHMPVLALLLLAQPGLDYGLRRLVLGAGATILVATASWFLLERPFLRLKNRLPGSPAGAEPAAAARP